MRREPGDLFFRSFVESAVTRSISGAEGEEAPVLDSVVKLYLPTKICI